MQIQTVNVFSIKAQFFESIICFNIAILKKSIDVEAIFTL